MTSDDTARLVNLLVATWPTGPKAYVWTQAIADLDAAGANRAYARLRDTVDRVTVASFLETHRAQRSPTEARRRDPSETCEHCAGTGYEPGPPEYETVYGEQHEYSTLVPCRCTQPARAASRAPAPPGLFEEF